MGRNYSIKNNPFVYGLQHKSEEVTEVCCGTGATYTVIPNPHKGFRPKYKNKLPQKDFQAMGDFARSAYFGGRTVRAVFWDTPRAIIDTGLQLIQSGFYLLAFPFLKAEFKATGSNTKELKKLKTYKLCKPFELTEKIRHLMGTDKAPSEFLNDIGMLEDYEKVDSLPNKIKQKFYYKYFKKDT